MLKQKIKSTFPGRLLISSLHCVESWLLPILIDDEHAVKRFYRSKTGTELNLDNPQSFSEKMNWLKLNNRLPLMQQCADKFAVRKYIEEKGYGDLLNTLLGVYNSVGDINIDDLPERFVLKATHGSHMNIIVKDNKKALNWKQNKLIMWTWLHQNIYWGGREWVYKDMPRRIIAEKYLEDETGELRDYKLFCYHGVPHFLQFDSGRLNGVHYRNYYDADLNRLDVSDTSTEPNPSLVPLDRETFEKMKQIASDLSKPFQFVRVDFYLVKGKIYFGEMTFFDGGGYSGFAKEEYDHMFGEPWTIQK